MTGKIVLNDADLDASARKLRTIAHALDGMQGRLTGNLAAGAPSSISSHIISEVVDVRNSLKGVSASSGRQSSELTHRAALTRLADKRGTPHDLAILLRMLAGPHKVNPGKRPSLGAIVKDLGKESLAGLIKPDAGVETIKGTAEQLAKFWATHTIRRNPGVAAAGVSKLKAFLTGRSNIVSYGQDVASHAGGVKVLEKVGRGAGAVGYGLSAISIVTAKGSHDQGKAVGETVGGVAGGAAGGAIGAAAGGAIGSVVPVVGTAIGAGVGEVAGSVVGGAVGSAVGGAVGGIIGDTHIGHTLGHGLDDAKHAFGDAASGAGHEAKKIWKSVF